MQLLEEAATDAAQRAAQLAGLLPRGEGREGSEDFAKSTARGRLMGPDDDEHPDRDGGLQARLADLPCERRAAARRDALWGSGDLDGGALLDDLCHPDTDHGWMWVLAAADSAILTKTEFVHAVRLRIGADVAPPRLDLRPVRGAARQPRPPRAAVCPGTLDPRAQPGARHRARPRLPERWQGRD